MLELRALGVCARSEWCKLFLAAAQGAEGMQASLARASDASDLDALPLDEPGSGAPAQTLNPHGNPD